jgi:transcriptional regulator with XRE-family HTH domain
MNVSISTLLETWTPPTVEYVNDLDSSGRRIARLRKAQNLTQEELASAARVSKSMLAKVETGHASASSAWIGAIARALGVDVARITGGPSGAGGAEIVPGLTSSEHTHRILTDVRRAMATYDLGYQRTADAELDTVELSDLVDAVARLGDLRRRTAYNRLGAEVVAVLGLLRIAEQTSTGHNLEIVYGLLTNTYRAINTLAHKLGYLDLSLTAIDRMDWAAARSGDQLLPPMVDYLRAAALGRIGEHRGAEQLLSRAIGTVEPSAAADRTARAVLGALHMKLIGIYGAIADPARVAVHHTEATRIAESTGPDHVVHETVFGPTNVQLHALSAHVDMAQPAEALAVADATEFPSDFPAERMTYFWIDKARAQLLAGNPDGAISALYQARAVAPIHFANSAVVKATIHSIAQRQRRGSRGLRPLANSAGLLD